MEPSFSFYQWLLVVTFISLAVSGGGSSSNIEEEKHILHHHHHDSVIHHLNWGDVFRDICWYSNPESTCSLNDEDVEYFKEQQCTLMDMFLGSRHYHPRVGKSMWKSKFIIEETEQQQQRQQMQRLSDISNDFVGVIHYDQCQQRPLNISISSQSNGVVSLSQHTTSSKQQQQQRNYNISSSFWWWTSLPRHQKLGIQGLLTILLIILGMCCTGMLKNPSTFTPSLRLAFNYRQHFISVLRLPSPEQSEKEDRFSFFDGLRVISMCWIVLAHSALYWGMFLPWSVASEMVFSISNDPMNYPLFAAVFAVDTFFLLGGVLSGYHLSMYLTKKLKVERYVKDQQQSHQNDTNDRHHQLEVNSVNSVRGKRKQGWTEEEDNGCFTIKNNPSAGDTTSSQDIQRRKSQRSLPILFKSIGLSILMVLQRYVRLMGVYAILMFGYLAIDWNTMSLPAGSRYLQSTNVACTEVAPSLLLLVNNVAHGEFVNECFGWSWYLSNDLQFFFVSVLVVIISISSKIVAWMLLGSLLIGCLSSSVYVCLKYQLGVVMDRLGQSYLNVAPFLSNRQYFPLHPVLDYFYVKNYIRIGPHLVGLAIGMILGQCKLQANNQQSERQQPSMVRLNGQHIVSASTSTTTQEDGDYHPTTKCDNNHTILDSHTDLPEKQHSRSFSINHNNCNDNYSSHHESSNRSSSLPPRHKKDTVGPSFDHATTKTEQQQSLRRSQSSAQYQQSITSLSSMPVASQAPTIIHSMPSHSSLLPIPSVNQLCFQPSCENSASFMNGDPLSQTSRRALSVSSNSTADSPLKSSKAPWFPVVERLQHSRTLTTADTQTSDSELLLSKSRNHVEDDQAATMSHHSSSSSFPIEHLPNVIQYLIRTRYILCMITVGIPTILILGGHIGNHEPALAKYWTVTVDALYLALSRTLWGISLGGLSLLLIFSSYHDDVNSNKANNNRHFIRFTQSIILSVKSFLSHRYWSPMSRLSYTMYLCHPIVIFGFFGNGYGPKTFMRGQLMGCYLFNLLMTFCSALFMSTFVELPLKHLVTGFFQVLMSTPTKKSVNVVVRRVKTNV